MRNHYSKCLQAEAFLFLKAPGTTPPKTNTSLLDRKPAHGAYQSLGTYENQQFVLIRLARGICARNDLLYYPMGGLSSHHPTFFGADRICQRHICTPNNRGKELCARLLAAVVGSYLPTLPTTYAETAMKIYQCGGREMMHGRHIA